MTGSYAQPEDRLLHLFERLRQLRFGRNPLQGSGVTMPQLTLLDWVTQSPGCGLQELADGLGLSAPTVSVAVRRLEEDGLLQRRPDPEDGRAIQISPTTEGRALHGRARTFRREKMRRLLAGLTPGEVETLLALLGKAVAIAEDADVA